MGRDGQWLVDATQKIDSRIHVAVLLGGDAGLRRGEIMAEARAAHDRGVPRYVERELRA